MTLAGSSDRREYLTDLFDFGALAVIVCANKDLPDYLTVPTRVKKPPIRDRAQLSGQAGVIVGQYWSLLARYGIVLAGTSWPTEVSQVLKPFANKNWRVQIWPVM